MNRLRVTIASEHWYPASVGGKSSCRVFDCLAKGLAELGHEVTCMLGGSLLPLPSGVTWVSEVPAESDIVHVADPTLIQKLGVSGRPWVRTRHVDSTLHGIPREVVQNTIYVSRTLAAVYGSDSYVWNGIDPEEYIYSEKKGDYVLFLCGLEWAAGKGFDIAVAAAREAGVRMVMGGSSRDRGLVERYQLMCAEKGVEYAGEVWGTRRAALLAGAQALLFPTQWNEAFGMVMAEALMSGTPVICSSNGACPELITPDVGFFCQGMEDYARAILRAHEIAPAGCREKAMRDFHYHRMTDEYVKKYRRFLECGTL